MLRVAFDPIYAHPLPEGHRFPMIKYEIIPEQLIYEGTITANNLFKPGICADDIILQTHTSAYLEKLNLQTLTESEQRKIGFPQSPELTLREKIITRGTIDCALYGIENGVSINVAGGTHHSFADHGEGFCLLNDFAIAANYLLDKKISKKIIIIDLDVHQGNGTAKIFEQEERVYTFSMHGAHNYPFHKEKSDTDIPLKVGTTDEEYLSTLRHYLNNLLDEINPDFAFYLSGVDILETDKFGKLKVTMQGCKKRDEYVFQSLHKRNIPCAVSMGGGYSPDFKTIVEAHCQTFRVAKEVYEL